MICGHNFIVTQIKSLQPSPYMTQVRGKAIHSYRRIQLYYTF